jgi:hypothetical protein
MKMKIVLLFAITGSLLFLSGCSAAVETFNMATGKEFWIYGMCDDATLIVQNDAPVSIRVIVGGHRHAYLIPPDSVLIIPGRYPVFSQVYRQIPITASVTPHVPSVRSAQTMWNFHHNGHYLGGGGITQGKEVHAVVELERLDGRTGVNRLVFRVR